MVKLDEKWYRQKELEMTMKAKEEEKEEEIKENKNCQSTTRIENSESVM